MMTKRVQKRCGRALGGMACAAGIGVPVPPLRGLPPEPRARRTQVTLNKMRERQHCGGVLRGVPATVCQLVPVCASVCQPGSSQVLAGAKFCPPACAAGGLAMPVAVGKANEKTS